MSQSELDSKLRESIRHFWDANTDDICTAIRKHSDEDDELRTANLIGIVVQASITGSIQAMIDLGYIKLDR